MTTVPTVVELCEDPELLNLSLSPAQRTLLKSIYGLSLNAEELALFQLCTGRSVYREGHAFRETAVIGGARSGKDSRILAPVMIWEALFGGHTASLAKGERGILPCIAADHRGTAVLYGYLKDYLTGSPMLSTMVEDVQAQEIRLVNRTSLLTFPSRAAAIRGWSIPACGADEIAWWRLDSGPDSDQEILASVRRGMVSFAHPRLVRASTPWLRSGVLYSDHQRAFGRDDEMDLLCWVAPSRLMNPTLDGAALEQQRRLDPSRFAREFEACFATDVDAFLSSDVLDAAIIPHRTELPPVPGETYLGAIDASGGTGRDAFTLALSHVQDDDQRIVVDVVRAWRGAVELSAVVRECADLARRYGVRQLIADRYGAEWVRQSFRDQHVALVPSPWSASQAYLELESLLRSGQVDLPDLPDLRRELGNLEKRYLTGGRVSIDHPRGAHDDLANVAALAAALALRYRQADRDPEDDRPDPDRDGSRPWTRREDEQTKEWATWKARARQAGMPETRLAELEHVPLPYAIGTVRDELERDSLAERMKRAGLSRRWD